MTLPLRIETGKPIWAGRPYPLGSTWDGFGVNFAIFSECATQVDLCLFDRAEDPCESRRFRLPERAGSVWHGYVPGWAPGQLYGYRVHGPFDPAAGHWCNPNKMLLDPYAKGIGRDLRWADSVFGYALGAAESDLSYNSWDSAPHAAIGAVIDPYFPWEADRPPRTPSHKTVIYELHVRGFTRLHPLVPEALRGTYAGLGSSAVIRYLKKLGVTSVELMPCHSFITDRHLMERGLKNFWGYNTLGFFAPESSYSCSDDAQKAVVEFKTMVKRLHRAGIEVILDVVYNHTAEGNQLGPTLSLRGIDNRSYYLLVEGAPRYYMDFTGCGNTLNGTNPKALQLVMDSLRYWITEMHLDGFRFDLASALAREFNGVGRLGGFFDIIQQDPVISQVKLIAEPWDLGPDGYMLGNFPVPWSEWNGRYRDCIRSVWRGDSGVMPEFATRLTGSSDLFASGGRPPTASVNFVTCHDGFTLEDLVSYNQKHNEANGEQNRDGADHNLSSNCGVEGPTRNRTIRAFREREERAVFPTLILSQGIRMLRAGDEFGNSQGGNNNAYCQDNPLTWLDWRDLRSPRNRVLLRFVRSVIRIYQQQPVFHRRAFAGDGQHGRAPAGEIAWLQPDGGVMTRQRWEASEPVILGLLLSGDRVDVDGRGIIIRGDTVLLLFNAGKDREVSFRLPYLGRREVWDVLFDTYEPMSGGDSFAEGGNYPLRPCSMVGLRMKRPMELERVHEDG